MPRRSYLRNRRLRVFGGPNGSGKSTILGQIDSKYDLGHYINADEIEVKLKTLQEIVLSDFGVGSMTKMDFENYLKNHTLVKKAKREGYQIDLFFNKGSIVNPDKNSHSYEAAFLADILRQELLKLGKKFAYETVMSHKSKRDCSFNCVFD